MVPAVGILTEASPDAQPAAFCAPAVAPTDREEGLLVAWIRRQHTEADTCNDEREKGEEGA